MVRKEYSAGGVKHPFWFLEYAVRRGLGEMLLL